MEKVDCGGRRLGLGLRRESRTAHAQSQLASCAQQVHVNEEEWSWCILFLR